MIRDKIIEKIFTTADDAMQGLLGLHMYTDSAIAVAPKDELLGKLPKDKFRLTHEWDRFYDSVGLVEEMEKVLKYVHCRTSLTSLVFIFEATIDKFIERLVELGMVKPIGSKYYKNLECVFSILKGSKSGSSTMLERLPITCGDVDNARRLRNSIAHNNGKYSGRYEDSRDIIDDGWIKVQFEPNYKKGAPILLTNARFEHFMRSHIELLHILHNTIQSKFFSHDEGYHYGREQKGIEWHRILSG